MFRKICFAILFCVLFLSTALAQEQEISVRGQILDDLGYPAIGAGVMVVGSDNKGVITDLDGNFTISAPRGGMLQISYLGYKTVEVPVAPQINLTLEPDSQALEAATISTGMTNIDRRLFTGASDRLAADDVVLSGVADISRSLEGRSAGVSVQNVTATFGTAPKIRVRGATSILGNSKPLWVVDGVIIEDVTEVNTDELSSGDAITMISSAVAGLNSDDIESINILKDGSATSIYGAKAMAGVIVITTKKGRAGSTKINYTGEFTMRLKPSYSEYNIMNSQDQMSVLQELADKGFLGLAETLRSSEYGVYGKMYELINTYDRTSGQFGLAYTQEAMNNYLRQAEYRNTDWFDLLFSNAIMQNHSVSVSMGTEKATSYISLSVMTDPGWYKRSSVERYTFNANTTFRILDNLSFTILGNGSYRKQQAPGTLTQETDPVFGEITRDFDLNPFSFAFNTSRTMDPDEYYVRNYTSFNVFEELENNYMDINATDLRFQGELKWTVLPGLDFNSLASLRYTQTSMQHHIMDDSNQARAYREMSDSVIQENNPFLYDDPDQLNQLPVTILPNGGIFEKREYRSPSYTIRNTLTWNHEFNNTHLVNLYGGSEITEVRRSNDWFRGWGMQYSQGEKAFFNYLAFKRASEQGEDYFTLENTVKKTAAFFAMAGYSYMGRYSLNGTFRYEGTNRLGRSRSARWLPTWNIGVAWNMHEEPWFRNLDFPLSHATFRASYSLTADAGPDWISNATAIITSFNTTGRPSSTDNETGLQIEMLGNSELTYEKKHELNIGASMGFLGNRINLDFDIYWRNNFDLLGLTNTAGVGGEIWRYANVADMKSNGLEFTLSTRNIEKRDFRWTTDFTFSWSEQEITNLSTDANIMNLVSGTGYNLQGYAPYSIFSIPFLGLDSEGFPIFEIGGETYTKENYSSIDFQETDEDILKTLKYEGPTDPIFTGGFGNTFTWKNLRLNIFMTYGFGNVIRLNQIFAYTYSDFYAMSGEFTDRWMVPGDEEYTNIPVIASRRQIQEYGSTGLRIGYNAYNYSTARVAKGDFIRMKEISLTYTFPKQLISRAKFDNLSLKFQVTNPFLIYSDKALRGQDPEYYFSGGVSSPLARQFTATLKFGF